MSKRPHQEGGHTYSRLNWPIYRKFLKSKNDHYKGNIFMWKQNIQFAFIYNFMTQTRTIFILQSYVLWSLRTVVSYLWAKRQEVLWLRRKCKMKNPIQSYCCLFLILCCPKMCTELLCHQFFYIQQTRSLFFLYYETHI